MVVKYKTVSGAKQGDGKYRFPIKQYFSFSLICSHHANDKLGIVLKDSLQEICSLNRYKISKGKRNIL